MTSFFTQKLKFRTGDKTSFLNITDQVKQVVLDSGVQTGLCIVMHVHSTAGLILDSIGDPHTSEDLVDEIDRLVPTRIDFHHMIDTPRDASGHVKAMLVGHSALLPIENGKINLSKSTGIFFCEFDGPRDRNVTVQIWSAGPEGS